jgi:hypothetical protein
MREVQFQRAFFGRYLTRLADWNKLSLWKFWLCLHFQDAMCRFGWAAALRGGEESQDVNL